LVYDVGGQSLGPGGRRLRTVNNGTNELFDDDDDPNSRRRRARDFGEDGDMDEQPYEEDFADDDEKYEEDNNDDEEAKELEVCIHLDFLFLVFVQILSSSQERIKREYRSANKQVDGTIDQDEDEEEVELTRDGKKMKKLIRNLEKNNAYESDEEQNPYASSVSLYEVASYTSQAYI
jgi:transcription initiation factor TFIIF subunit alpha